MNSPATNNLLVFHISDVGSDIVNLMLLRWDHWIWWSWMPHQPAHPVRSLLPLLLSHQLRYIWKLILYDFNHLYIRAAWVTSNIHVYMNEWIQSSLKIYNRATTIVYNYIQYNHIISNIILIITYHKVMCVHTYTGHVFINITRCNPPKRCHRVPIRGGLRELAAAPSPTGAGHPSKGWWWRIQRAVR